jgi:hypothetical protein
MLRYSRQRARHQCLRNRETRGEREREESESEREREKRDKHAGRQRENKRERERERATDVQGDKEERESGDAHRGS